MAERPIHNMVVLGQIFVPWNNRFSFIMRLTALEATASYQFMVMMVEDLRAPNKDNRIS